MWRNGSKTPEVKNNGNRSSEERNSAKIQRSDEGSRSRSRHSRSCSRYSRSRSRDRKRSYSRSRSRERSRSRTSARGRRDEYQYGTTTRRDEPEPSRCLGIFGLSLYTTERDIKELFSQFGELESVQLVFDHPTGRSRGFGFLYFKNLEDAIEAKERVLGTEIDGHKIRVDYSITKRAHTPTPGIYMGAGDTRRHVSSRNYRRSPSPYRYRSSRYHDSPPRRSYGRNYDYDYYDRFSPYRERYRHSPSPRYYDDRRRRRSRSYDRGRGDYY